MKKSPAYRDNSQKGKDPGAAVGEGGGGKGRGGGVGVMFAIFALKASIAEQLIPPILRPQSSLSQSLGWDFRRLSPARGKGEVADGV